MKNKLLFSLYALLVGISLNLYSQDLGELETDMKELSRQLGMLNTEIVKFTLLHLIQEVKKHIYDMQNPALQTKAPDEEAQLAINNAETFMNTVNQDLTVPVYKYKIELKKSLQIIEEENDKGKIGLPNDYLEKLKKFLSKLPS